MAHGAQTVAISLSRRSRRFSRAVAGVLAGCLLILPREGWAQDKPADTCENAVNQNDLNRCAADAADKANADMVVALAKAKKAMEAVDKDFASKLYGDPVSAAKALETSQRGWLDYREGRCVIAGFAEHGGSMEPMVVSTCEEEMTRVRISELNELAEE